MEADQAPKYSGPGMGPLTRAVIADGERILNQDNLERMLVSPALDD